MVGEIQQIAAIGIYHHQSSYLRIHKQHHPSYLRFGFINSNNSYNLNMVVPSSQVNSFLEPEEKQAILHRVEKFQCLKMKHVLIQHGLRSIVCASVIPQHKEIDYELRPEESGYQEMETYHCSFSQETTP
jgi:predicted nucleotidyltransferase